LDTDAPTTGRARSLRRHGYVHSCRDAAKLFRAVWKLYSGCGLHPRAMLTVNCRSWSDCWLRLVVRCVNNKPVDRTPCQVFAKIRLQTDPLKAITSPLSATVTLSTRSSRTTAQPLLARNRGSSPLTQTFFGTGSLRKHRDGLGLTTKCIISRVDISTAYQIRPTKQEDTLAMSVDTHTCSILILHIRTRGYAKSASFRSTNPLL
jgi:hypothetical protein